MEAAPRDVAWVTSIAALESPAGPPIGEEGGKPGADGTIRVGMRDDRVAARQELRRLLDGEIGVSVIDDLDDGRASVAALSGAVPDVLVLELQMSGASSIELVSALSARTPETRIVVLAAESSPLFARKVLDAGARCFVLREQADRDLPKAVRQAAAGAEFVSRPVAKALEASLDASGEDSLTPREIEVLRLTALGFTGAEIAVQLGLSRRTVESHRATLHRKLGMASRAELVGYALRHRLLGV
jgi:DNA-binding NarL/FixJ family response regulator